MQISMYYNGQFKFIFDLHYYMNFNINLKMQKYKLGNKLSSGAFGTVYNAQVTSGPLQGQTVAIKQIYVSDFVKRELQILTNLKSHPNIVKCHEIIEQNEYERSIVMEKGQYDLDTLIDSLQYPIDQTIVKIAARGMLTGLHQLHSQGYIHRDLKPSNIVIKQGRETVAICDFGSAVKCTTGQQYVIEGFTRWYKPPEMLFGSRKYKYEVDIWSLGSILLQLATGAPLFAGNSELQQIALIANFIGDPSVKNWPSIVNLHDYGKINFVERPPKTKQQISKELNISIQLTNFIMKMIKYEGRSTTEQLLQDQYLKIDENQPICQLNLGIFGMRKIHPKIIR